MTGNFRSIATQGSCTFSTKIILDKVTGAFYFGFNNINNKYFTFNSGLIYDANNNPVWGYAQNNSTILSGTAQSGVLNYWINNIPVSFQESCPNYISGFSFNWDDTILNPTYYINFWGAIPKYQIYGVRSALTGQNITGYVLNKESNPLSSFRIFSGSIPNSSTNFASLYTGHIAGQSSGAFVISGFSNQGIFNIPLTFNTNFGTVNSSITVAITGNN